MGEYLNLPERFLNIPLIKEYERGTVYGAHKDLNPNTSRGETSPYWMIVSQKVMEGVSDFTSEITEETPSSERFRLFAEYLVFFDPGNASC